MSEKAKEIISYLQNNGFTTTEVADSLAKTGRIPALFPIKQMDKPVVGLARCMFTANGTNFYLHDQIEDIEADEIPLIFTANCNGRAIFGDIIAKYIFDRKKASAVVVQGDMRDFDELRDNNYPIWCKGTTPIGCINKPTSPFPYEEKEATLLKYDRCILICDGCGVVAIPQRYHNDHFIDRLRALRLQEEAWKFCIEELGWTTKETITEKRYLEDPKVLPDYLIENLQLLQTDFTKEPAAI